ncbi:4-alpha-glucanotransferase [Xanthomonas hortorum pv. vitians]|uniref:4-alpha-glucanotransferase n=1 Tax=Xanthomonas hortorum pv. vitians TaxID=83224 RepID=A0A6V7BJJ8_9XANT|nr:4-alpha-glucanotransferase [Xanthomonas hortorum]ASW47636.1 4-alpha-glucanotransferase [Xanthomonas hortorum]MCC8493446.1 4-alpha-glucanotransferase [Xanthomonas hortorum pv. gardneri]MCE4281526.1 4-alpha-glucanotransferase [Xanthomonas hortorum pv. vitians]MCE4286239.1 4-alpha-glucanotransferase [Xanthomonas hortorum pv. vitians]MCE4290700.1 4-alpha-glucanotransferase [Xanthomonas hortorum pv. vitians]
MSTRDLSRADLHTLAAAAGVMVDWVDASDQPRQVSEQSLHAVLTALELSAATATQREDSLRRCKAQAIEPAPLLTVQVAALLPVSVAPNASGRWVDDSGASEQARADAQGQVRAPQRFGYWTLQIGELTQQVAVAPQRCFSVADACGLPAPRAWGMALQVYSARSIDDGGIGDASGTVEWVRHAALAGADALALSPVHASRPVTSGYSPYSPSDRRFLDPLHAAPVRVLGELALDAINEVPGLRERFDTLHHSALIDWPASAQAKWQLLRHLYTRVAADHADLVAFRSEGGAALEGFARFAAQDFGDGDPQLHVFTQWLAARSWSDAQREAHERGMKIGLIADLAVGFDPNGAEAAAAADTVLRGLVLGAPPDAFNADGQHWGIGAYSPTALRRSGYAPYIALLRAVLRDRGGIRIDHILGLLRLWVVPEGASSNEGAYLAYPLHDLLNLLALESWRHRAIVIGEDLGVVPPGIREELSRRGVMGIDVLMFTRDDNGAFVSPALWRPDAVATTTTHDLPTLTGWREGRDIDWRRKLELIKPAQASDDATARSKDLARLDAAVEHAGLSAAHDPLLGALRFTASSVSPLALLPVEDALALEEQPNLPGTVEVHPNWRRRLPDPLPHARLSTALQGFAEARRVAAVSEPHP